MESTQVISDPIAEVAAKAKAASARVYLSKNIWVGAFLGGPLVAGYMIARNFNTFEERQKSVNTWRVVIPLSMVIFYLSSLIPENVNFPSIILSLMYAGISVHYMKKYQGHHVALHLEHGGAAYSWGRVIAVSLLGILLTGLFFAAIFASAELAGDGELLEDVRDSLF